MAKKAAKKVSKKPARKNTGAKPAPVRVKRVYDAPAKTDGLRVLVDRLWPRGLTKDKAGVDLWLKDAAPSTELRKAYHADELSFAEFTKRYRKELDPSTLEPVREALAAGKAVTLLFASRQIEQNHAHVLSELLARG